MNNTELIHVDVLENGISTTDDAQIAASNLVDELSAIQTVNSVPTQASAVATATNAQRFLKDLEASRKSVKAPVLEISRKIDALADELASPVRAEMSRVGQMVARFQTLEAERVAKEQREREAAEQAAMAAKHAAEQAAEQAAAGMTTEQDLNAAIEAEKQAETAKAKMYQTLTAPAPAAVKATGSVTKKVLRYAVTDIAALAKHSPHLVKMEPNVAAIKATCNERMIIPGLKLWTELDTTFRTR